MVDRKAYVKKAFDSEYKLSFSSVFYVLRSPYPVPRTPSLKLMSVRGFHSNDITPVPTILARGDGDGDR